MNGAPTAAAVANALGHVYDPELGIDVVALGLVYAIEVANGRIAVDLAMTTNDCPMAGIIREMAGEALASRFPGATVEIQIADTPPWDIAMADESALQELGLVRP
jgi:metal-sulfur cluster biosynthetic enzyme